MKNKKMKFPIKHHIFPKSFNNGCPICRKDISKGQVVLMLNDGGSAHLHFHEKNIFEIMKITKGQCDLNFCSTNCLRKFFDCIVSELEESYEQQNKNI